MRLARIFTFFLLLAQAPAAIAQTAATVTRVQGVAQADGQALRPGDTLSSGRRLTTAAASRVELRFADDTTVVLGEGADFTVAEFAYAPAAGSGAAHFHIAAGTFLVSTGAVAKLPGRPLGVTTPVASIGVRGTRFWGGSLDHPLDVLLLEGAVSVRTRGGSVELERPLDGTEVTAPNSPPAPVGRWGQERVDKALRSVAFD